MSIPVPHSDVAESLRVLGNALAGAEFPLPTPQAEIAQDTCADITNQLNDYVLPRYASLDAPLLAVVGGSTGSGKSTLVNSLVREEVTVSSAIRPTTRRPVLVHRPDNEAAFASDRILPTLARVRFDSLASEEDAAGPASLELRLVSHAGVPEGLAVLDSPDIDSVVESNRRLAAQLLSAADLWVFVTTAARYADAIPWALLDQAAARNIVVAIVLNRVPQGVGSEIRPDLVRRLEERGLGAAPLFVIGEKLDADGLIPEGDVAPLRGWLTGLAHDATARASVARQTLGGAVDSIVAKRAVVVSAVQEQHEAVAHLAIDIDRSVAGATTAVLSSLEDGSVLKGEVLARWQEVVGTGEWMRKLESGVSSVRDRIAGWFRGTTPDSSVIKMEHAVADSLQELFVSSLDEAIATIEAAWEVRPGGRNLLAAVQIEGLSSRESRSSSAAEAVREWQRNLLNLVNSEGKNKRSTARLLSVGVNAVGAALMIVVFASTSGLTGGEVAVAGGTAILAQRVLEAVFGDDAVRRMAASARTDLELRARAFMEKQLDPFRAVVIGLGVPDELAESLDRDFQAVASERAKENNR